MMEANDLCKLLICSYYGVWSADFYASFSLITPKQRSYEWKVKPRQAELSGGSTMNLYLY